MQDLLSAQSLTSSLERLADWAPYSGALKHSSARRALGRAPPLTVYLARNSSMAPNEEESKGDG